MNIYNKVTLISLLVIITNTSFSEDTIAQKAQEAVEIASKLKSQNDLLKQEVKKTSVENTKLTKSNSDKDNKLSELQGKMKTLESRINKATMMLPRMVCRGEKSRFYPTGAEGVGCGDPYKKITAVCNGRKSSVNMLFTKSGNRCGYTCYIYTCLNL